MRTSVTHPLQIAAVVSGIPGLGRVGVTFCPGKYDPEGMTGAWNRDLSRDLDAIRDWGAMAVVTLLEPREIKLVRVERLGEEVQVGICRGSTFQSSTRRFRMSDLIGSGI